MAAEYLLFNNYLATSRELSTIVEFNSDFWIFFSFCKWAFTKPHDEDVDYCEYLCLSVSVCLFLYCFNLNVSSLIRKFLFNIMYVVSGVSSLFVKKFAFISVRLNSYFYVDRSTEKMTQSATMAIFARTINFVQIWNHCSTYLFLVAYYLWGHF